MTQAHRTEASRLERDVAARTGVPTALFSVATATAEVLDTSHEEHQVRNRAGARRFARTSRARHPASASSALAGRWR